MLKPSSRGWIRLRETGEQRDRIANLEDALAPFARALDNSIHATEVAVTVADYRRARTSLGGSHG